MACERVAKTKERGRAMRGSFADAYGVTQLDHSAENVRRLFLQGGASLDAVRGVLEGRFGAVAGSDRLAGVYGVGEPFEHFEFYGRGDRPLFFFGHPYTISVDFDEEPYIGAEAAETLDAVRGLGLSVRVLGRRHSWYGMGTVQVAVYHWPTVVAACGPCPPFPLSPVDCI